MSRRLKVSAAQLGPIHRADSRKSVVKRLVEMLKEADSRSSKFVVFPELALTTFFPRWWIEDQAEVDRYFEAQMPSPGPIAWVTTVGPSGVVNAAPFSFFNVFAEDPPLCMVAINKRRDGRIKDTWTNIERSGEFVVNLTDEPLALKMHESSGDFPPDIGEPDYLGLKLALSVDVKPPRLADAPWSMECRVWQTTNVKDDRQLVIGEGLRFHIRDELWDPKAMRVHMDRYHPVGRMFADRYCRTNDRMEFPPAPVVKAKAAE